MGVEPIIQFLSHIIAELWCIQRAAAAILAAILDFSVTSRSNPKNNNFIGFPVLQNMGVEPISVSLSHILAELWSFQCIQGVTPGPNGGHFENEIYIMTYNDLRFTTIIFELPRPPSSRKNRLCLVLPWGGVPDQKVPLDHCAIH